MTQLKEKCMRLNKEKMTQKKKKIKIKDSHHERYV